MDMLRRMVEANTKKKVLRIRGEKKEFEKTYSKLYPIFCGRTIT